MSRVGTNKQKAEIIVGSQLDILGREVSSSAFGFGYEDLTYALTHGDYKLFRCEHVSGEHNEVQISDSLFTTCF